MTTAQILLSDAETQAIQALGQRRGQSQQELLHEAVAQFLEKHTAENRLAAIRQARGIWQQRQDFPDLADCRASPRMGQGP